MDYEAEDKVALKRALLALRVCPLCRRELVKVRSLTNAEVFECSPSDEYHDPIQYHLPKGKD